MTDAVTTPAYWTQFFRQRGPEVIHVVGHSEEVIRGIEEGARSLSMRVFRVDVGDIRKAGALFELLAERMSFFIRDPGWWQTIIDQMSGVDDWAPNEHGYVVLIERADGLRRNTRRTFNVFLEILTDVWDRRRELNIPYHVVLTGDVRMRAAAAGLVQKGNASLQDFYQSPSSIELGQVYVPCVLRDHGDPLASARERRARR